MRNDYWHAWNKTPSRLWAENCQIRVSFQKFVSYCLFLFCLRCTAKAKEIGKGVFRVKTSVAIIPTNRVNSVNTYFKLSTNQWGSEQVDKRSKLLKEA